MTNWLFWSVMTIYIIHAVFVAAIVTQINKHPWKTLTGTGSLIVLSFIPFTIIWWAYIIFG